MSHPVPFPTGDFEARLAQAAQSVEATLDALLGAAPESGETTRPARLLDAMRYATLGAGKRLRPFLVIESARLFGADGQDALRAGAALEMVHCYSLVHDDLPAMDDDDLRRGRPTVHRAFEEATAILAGDALLTLAFDVLSGLAADAATRLDLVRLLARAAGIGGMAGGQALDLAAESALAPLDGAAVAQLQAMKTGALLKAAVAMGGRLGGADAAQAVALAAYGEALGAAFQIADDILDAEGDEAALGKRAGKDAARNKATLVATLGLEAARRRRDDLVAVAQAALRGAAVPGDPAVLIEAAAFVGRRSA